MIISTDVCNSRLNLCQGILVQKMEQVFMTHPLSPNSSHHLEETQLSSSCRYTQLDDGRSYADIYHLQQKLQQGGQAAVYKASKNEQKYAIKIYRGGAKGDRDFNNEVNLLNKLSHPGLVAMVDSVLKTKTKWQGLEEEDRNIVIMPFMERGDLYQKMKKVIKIPHKAAQYFSQKLLSTFIYLSSKGILHRDIKPENILLGDRFEPLLIDFGFSCTCGHKCRFVGDARFAAPELFRQKEYTFQSEIYSLGILLFYLLTGVFPYNFAKISQQNYSLLFQKKVKIFWQKIEAKISFEIPEDFKQVFVKMVNPKPEERPNFDILMEFEWFKDRSLTEQEYFNMMNQQQKKKQLL